MFNFIKLTLSLLVLSLSCSCMQRGYTVNINKIGDYPKPLVETLPLRVGIFYSQRFRTFYKIEQIHIPNTDLTLIKKIKVGKANTALFRYIFSHVFEHTNVIDKFDEHVKNHDLIIAPEIDSLTYNITSENKISYNIKYSVNFFLPDGDKIVWSIEGKSEKKSDFAFKNDKTLIVDLAHLAMRQVAAKFFTGFCEQEKINFFYNGCKQ